MRHRLRESCKKKAVLLSHILNENTPLYGGKRDISLKADKTMGKGSHCRTMRWSFSNHSGTHIDAPAHFIEDGISVSDMRASDFIFSKIALVDIPDAGSGKVINCSDISSLGDCELLLIRTGFEKYRGKDIYWADSPCLDPDLALLKKKKAKSLRAIGIDFISASNFKNSSVGIQAHKSILGNGICLIEDMKLSTLVDIPNMVVVAPVLVENADGAPCTVMALTFM